MEAAANGRSQAILADEETLVWLHIPKTAGTSLIGEIERFGIPYLHIAVDTATLDHESFLDATRRRLAEYRDQLEREPVRLIFGHITQRDVTAVLGRNTCFVFATMLRDPIERILSQYFYATSPSNPHHLLVLEKYPTLESGLDSGVRNIMSRFLEDYPEEPGESIARRLHKQYAFCGRLETYDIDFRRLAALFGHDHGPVERCNLGTNKPHVVSQGARDRIAMLNNRDCALYSQFVEYTKTE